MPGQPFTKVVPGDGTSSATFEVPSFFAVDLESVLANVDASGAGDTIATLTVADQGGEPVATVAQGRAISGGGQGRATWALRLADDNGAGATAATKYEAFRTNSTTNVPFASQVVLPFIHGFGDVLGAFALGEYVIAAAGTYALALNVQSTVDAASYFAIAQLQVAFGSATQQDFKNSAAFIAGNALGENGPMFAITRKFDAGARLVMRVTHNNGAAVRMRILGGLAKLA